MCLLCYHLSLCFLNKDSFPPPGWWCQVSVCCSSRGIHESVGFMSVFSSCLYLVSRVYVCVCIVVVTLGKFWSFGNPDSRAVMAAAAGAAGLQPIWVVFCLFCHLVLVS